MIKTELLNDGTLIKHYSNEGFMIRQIETDSVYEETIDLVPCVYTYEETDIKIETEVEQTEEENLEE